MEQLDIFDYLNMNDDPVFLMINKLNKGQFIRLGDFTITQNHLGIYEIESGEIHKSKPTAIDMYKLFKDINNNISYMGMR